MLTLSLTPSIYNFASCADFNSTFKPTDQDLILTNEFIFKPYFGSMNLKCDVIFQEKYGTGEPSDDMLEAILRDIDSNKVYKRIIAIGGGTIIDLSKLLSLKKVSPVLDLYDGKISIEKDKDLIIIPTTCGTGSEVTNISILALNSRGTKKGLANDALFADYAVLIPELLKGLPFKFFATSSIDALIHAVESTLSPKGNELTRLFGYKAIETILKGYKIIAADGEEARVSLLEEFLMASTIAGIAFSNAGCAAVHALSYPLGAKYHVAHGEANYAIFTGVLNNYIEIKQDGEIATLNKFIANILGCKISNVYTELEKLLNNLIVKKPLREYGVSKEELSEFTKSVMINQGRLMANNFVKFDENRIYKIYQELY